MMRIAVAAFFILFTLNARAQELFIQTEPASNMPARSWGLRLASDMWNANDRVVARLGFEAMYGITKDLMVHLQGFGSNQVDNFELETYGLYAKYRLYADDDFKYHFRLAVFGEALFGKQNSHSPSFASKGSGPLLTGGVIATLLEGRFAASTTLGVAKATKDIEAGHPTYKNIVGANGSLSMGYLIYPDAYESYSDPNVNIYAEVLGFTSMFDEVDHDLISSTSGTEILLSFGPQVILNSLTRIDLAYALTLHSSYTMKKQNSVFIRLEHNFF